LERRIIDVVEEGGSRRLEIYQLGGSAHGESHEC